MPTTIKLKNSVTTTSAPTSLAQGEVAINVTDKKVWVGNAATTPVQLLGDGGSGSFTSIAFGAGTVSAPSITFTGDTNTGIYSPAADTIAFTEGGVESMRIDSSGNVGIGTSSPSTPLSGARGLVLNSGATNDNQIRLQNDKTGSTASDGFLLSIDGSTPPNAYVYNYENSPIVFGTNNAERMRIDSSGNVLVGTTGVSGKLTVFGNSGGTCAQFNANSNTVTPVGIIVGANDTTQAAVYVYSNTNGNFNTYIYSNGNLQNRNNSYGGISDVKLKENIVDATPKLEDLCKVKVRQYNFKSDPEHKQIGVVAQEIEEIFPNIVEETPEKDINGNDLGEATKAVKYSVFVPMLIKAIQELKAELDSVKAELQKLKGA